MSCITLENVEIFKNENLFMKQKEKTIEEIKKITHISLI